MCAKLYKFNNIKHEVPFIVQCSWTKAKGEKAYYTKVRRNTSMLSLCIPLWKISTHNYSVNKGRRSESLRFCEFCTLSSVCVMQSLNFFWQGQFALLRICGQAIKLRTMRPCGYETQLPKIKFLCTFLFGQCRKGKVNFVNLKCSHVLPEGFKVYCE